MSDFAKFKENLPRKEKLYGSFINRKVNDKEYNNVLTVYNKFEMKMIKDYDDLCLNCDGLLSTDVFVKFRSNSLKNYGLCPSHYLSSPGLSWNAIRKMTKTKLELITDVGHCMFFEKSTRGGISYISNSCS